MLKIVSLGALGYPHHPSTVYLLLTYLLCCYLDNNNHKDTEWMEPNLFNLKLKFYSPTSSILSLGKFCFLQLSKGSRHYTIFLLLSKCQTKGNSSFCEDAFGDHNSHWRSAVVVHIALWENGSLWSVTIYLPSRVGFGIIRINLDLTGCLS